MMNIEEIAKQILEDKDKTWKHTKRVVKLCCKFTQQLDADICVKILHEAAWLHDTGKTVDKDDTGKTVDKKDHHKADVVLRTLEPYQEKLQCNMETLLSVIQAHKGDFVPPEGYELESAVLRICDKLDKYHQAGHKAEKGDNKEAVKKYQEAVKKCNDSMIKIKAVLADDVWNAFENAYAQVLAQMFQ